MPEINEVERKPTAVPISIIAASETLRMETDDHLTVPHLKVEDPDIDISAEQLEGGEDLELGDDSLWQNQVKLPPPKLGNRLLIADCFLARQRRMMKMRTGATLKA